MSSGRFMLLIPCEDPRQVPQESLSLKVIMTCIGMQHTNMISTRLQDKNRGRLSSHIKFILFDEPDHEFGEDNLNDSDEVNPSPYSVFQSSINSTEPKKPTKVFIPYQFWREFPEAAKQMNIDCNKRINVANPRPHFNGGNTKTKSTLGQSNPNSQ